MKNWLSNHTIKLKIKQTYNINQDNIEKAYTLFEYAKSIIKIYSVWDKNKLPNPELYLASDEDWIKKINLSFSFAMNFIFCHEFSHVEKEHHEKYSSGQNTNNHIITFEKEADQRAIELILEGITNENKTFGQLGVLAGICSMLFFNKETHGGPRHPDVDDRIHNFLEKLNLDESDPAWGVAVVAYKLWEGQFKKDLNLPNEADSLKDYYYLIKNQIQKEK